KKRISCTALTPQLIRLPPAATCSTNQGGDNTIQEVRLAPWGPPSLCLGRKNRERVSSQVRHFLPTSQEAPLPEKSACRCLIYDSRSVFLCSFNCLFNVYLTQPQIGSKRFQPWLAADLGSDPLTTQS